MIYDEFKKEVYDLVEQCPKYWRKGQAVFNVLDTVPEYKNVARRVQFEDGVDCFYNDDAIDDFLLHAYYHLAEKEN